MDKKEHELLDRFKNGDQDAFVEIFKGHKEMIFRVAYSLAGERETAKDITQDVFIRIYKHLAGFAARSSLRTWIYRITINVAKDYSRKRSFLPLFDALLQRADQGSDPQAIAEQTDRAKRLREAIGRLPIRQKQVFILKNEEGLRYTEIGEILGVKVGAVKALVHRATNNLRKTLGEEQDD